eukprot:TRINITY_DN16937_c0_g1_i2.p1 TRINITY_DN16937_c0_g1~~TRINITY_DN16937_c0_g1_i2.p1  ORF type:complete len:715 (-),score=114.05 TRINITY_DN16937_c0_g1_i2:88-2232(-)
MVRAALEKFPDILDVKVSVADRSTYVEHRSSLDPQDLVVALNEKGLGAMLKEHGEEGAPARASFTWQDGAAVARLCLQVVLYAVGVVLVFSGQKGLVSEFAFLLCVLLSYTLFYRAGIALWRRHTNVELLMSLAMTGCLVQNMFQDAALVGLIVVMIDSVKFASMRAMNNRLNACFSMPSSQIVLANGLKIPTSELEPGMIFLVRVGEAIIADGTVVKGRGTVDESRVTGEAHGVFKEKDASVCSGSVLQAGFLEVVATAAADKSFEARILESVRMAKDTLSSTQSVMNNFAAFYTPAVIFVAVVVAIVQQDVNQFLVIIVAGCPCALLGAAPLTQAAALGVLAKRHGLLLKHTSCLESLARLRWIGIDKTGTITTGNFSVQKIHSVSEWTQEEVLKMAASLESKDNHPLAQSIVQSYTGCHVNFSGSGALLEVTNFKRQGRSGVTGIIEGRVVGVGNADFLVSEKIGLDGAAAELRETWSPEGSVLFVTVDGSVAALLLLADVIRNETSGTITRLSALDVKTVLLTGDKGPAAKLIAAEAGIEEVHFGLLPDEKSTHILEASWGGTSTWNKDSSGNVRGPVEVGFLGDGLNDCPALAHAHVGIVLRQLGASSTVEAATAVLEKNIGHIPAAITVARRTQFLVIANIILAMGLNVAVIIAATVWGIPLWLSVVVDNGSLLLVLANSMWPLCWRVAPVIDDAVDEDVAEQFKFSA